MSHGVAKKPSSVEQARRIAIGVAWGLVPVLFVGWLAGDSEAPMSAWARAVGIFERVALLALASAVVASAGLFGMVLLRLMGGADIPVCHSSVPSVRGRQECLPYGSLFARFVLGAGVGLGVLSLLTLALGCAGLLTPVVASAVVAAMLIIGAFEIRSVGDFLRRAERPRFPRLGALELACVFVMLLVLVFQTLLAFNLPTDYDACEYHMAAPWRWAQVGRIDYIEGNVYTNLPMNAEMLYFFSMKLVGGPGVQLPAPVSGIIPRGGAWDRLCFGVHLGVVMNMMTALLATAAVFVLARRWFSRRAALVAATLFFSMPWTMVATTVNIHNEILLAFWATLAVYALLEFCHGGTDILACPRGDRQECLSYQSGGKVAGWGHGVRWLVLSAVFAGFAAGVKYTALGFFPPVLAAAAVVVLWKSSRLKSIAAALLAPPVVLVVVSPWFIKNVAFTGNPVFPFAYKQFGGRDWSDELDWKWYAGNMKAAGADKAGNLLVATFDRVVLNKWGSLAIAAFALLALVAWRQRAVRWLWILLVLWTLLWYFATHRVDRFWLPMAGVAAALAGCGFEAIERKHLRAVSTALLAAALGWQLFVTGLIFSANAAGNYDLIADNGQFLSKRYELEPLVRFEGVSIREHLQMLTEFMLVGEARTLYLPTNVRYSTAFNEEVFTRTVGSPRDPSRVGRRLDAANVSEVFVNWFEVGRLRESYALTDHQGRSHPGFPDVSPTDFQRLAREGVVRPAYVDYLASGSTAEERRAWFAFPKAKGRLPGLTSEDMAALPDGQIAEIYSVRRDGLPVRKP